MYECANCWKRTVMLDGTFDYQDYGIEGDGLVLEGHCTSCGALVTYCIPEDDDNASDNERERQMNTMYPTVRFKKVDPEAPTPAYAHDGDAGMDLCSMETVEISPQGMVKVRSGIAVAIPREFYGMLVPRSGMSTKRGITLINTPATIDSGYRGEVILPLYNASTEMQVVEAGERVCQLLIVPVAHAFMEEVDDLDETERGGDGFGSTGFRGKRL